MDKSLSLTVITIEGEVQNLVITSDEDMAKAGTMLTNVNITADKVKEEKEKVTVPLNEALKAEKSRWEPIETVCKSIILTLRTKMKDYNDAVAAKAKLDAERITARVEKGTMKPETAVAKLQAQPEANKVIDTGAGSIQWMNVQRLVIDDINLIPHEYFDLNEPRLKAALKLGAIPGAHMITEKIVKNTR